MDKVILHVDLNNFYASVECIKNPEIKDLPVVVCGNPELRHGVVLAKNQIAKLAGVKTGDTILEAERKCKGLIKVPPNFDDYIKYSKAVREIYYSYTDRIETFGLDECWLDVTGSQKLFGNGEQIADKIRKDVREKTGLTVSVGVSFTKVFAKLGSDMKKPDATTVISRENYKQKIWNLPVQELLYIGKKTCEKLKRLQIRTIGDLANASIKDLTFHFGKIGVDMHNNANGIENYGDVLVFDQKTPVKSVGNGMTTKRDMATDEDVKTVIYYLAESVSSRLRSYGFLAGGVSVNMRSNDLSSFVRQKSLPTPTNLADDIARACFEIFKQNYSLATMRPLRTITIATHDLISENGAFQTSFLYDEVINEKAELGKSIDKIRHRFGNSSLFKAGFIDNDLIGEINNLDEQMLPFEKGNRTKN